LARKQTTFSVSADLSFVRAWCAEFNALRASRDCPSARRLVEGALRGGTARLFVISKTECCGDEVLVEFAPTPEADAVLAELHALQPSVLDRALGGRPRRGFTT